MNKVARYITLICCALSAAGVRGQSVAYQQFTVEDGLPSNYVYRLAEDEAGYLWAATEQGIARYDGFTWRSYGLGDGLHALDNYELLAEPSGAILCGGKGHRPVRLSRGSLKQIELDDEPTSTAFWGLARTYPPLLSAYEFHDDHRKLSFYNPTSRKRIIQTKKLSHYSQIINPNLLENDPKSISLLNGFFLINLPNTMPYVYVNHGRDTIQLTQTNINRITALKPMDGNWGWFDFKNKAIQLVQGDTLTIIDGLNSQIRYSLSKYVGDSDINTAYCSRTGDLWIASRNRGVIRVPKQNLNVRILPGTQNRSFEGTEKLGKKLLISDDYCNLYSYQNFILKRLDIFQDNQGGFRFKLMKTQRGDSSVIFLRNNLLYEIKPEGIYYFSLDSLTPATDRATPPQFSYRNPINIQRPDAKTKGSTSIFVPTNLAVTDSFAVSIAGNKMFFFNGDHWTQHSEALTNWCIVGSTNTSPAHIILADRSGLWRVNASSELTILWPSDSLSITNAFPWTDQSYILATEQSGLFKLQLSVSDTLLQPLAPINQVNGFNTYHGELWVSSNHGLWRLDSTGKQLLHLTRHSGLLTDEVYDTETFGDSIMIATAKGLAVIHKDLTDTPPRQIEGLNVNLSYVSINGIKHEDVKPDLKLTSEQRNLSFSFGLLDIGRTEDVWFEYDLQPSDQLPRRQQSRTVSYSALAPGDYKLHVSARVGDGSVYQLAQPIAFTLPAPLYQRPWFWGLLVLSAGSLLWWSVKSREKRKAQAQISEQAALRQTSELQLEALRSQMNPHFVFNALGSIQYYIQEAHPEKADHYLARFAKLMRRYLDASRMQLVPLKDELLLIEQYVALELMRFEDQFSFSLRVAENVNLEEQLPSMILQPFVENAILHGLSTRTDGQAKLELHIDAVEDDLHIKIVDNGIGLAAAKQRRPSNHRSRSSDITNQRIAALKAAGIAHLSVQYTALSPDDAAYPGTVVGLKLNFPK